MMAKNNVKSLPAPQATPRQPTDIGNAKVFVVLQGENVRYSHTSRKWLNWDGKRWAEDNTGEIERKAKDTAIQMWEAAVRVKHHDIRMAFQKHALKTQYESRLKAMIALARSEPGIPITEAELDSDRWLLNVENGTLNLRIGKLREHRREDLITKLIPVPYNPQASCPLWDAFLNRIMGGDQELIKFLQTAVGYALVGDMREQVIFIFYGTGANGKSTFLVTIHSLLGDYARQTPTDTLLTKKGSTIPNDVARLKGSRFVEAAEVESGKQLAESLVKQLTGGDKMSARFLYGEYFEFDPTFKIFLAVNHKPTIRGSDHAIWRRIRLVPFNVTIPPEEQDKTLVERLRSELPGILRWAVEGCRLWQRDGLEIPDSVKAATGEYRKEMDVIGDFITECCEEVPEVKTPFKAIYERYEGWCEQNQEEPIGTKGFGTCLNERGFPSVRTSTERFRKGIRLSDDT